MHRCYNAIRHWAECDVTKCDNTTEFRQCPEQNAAMPPTMRQGAQPTRCAKWGRGAKLVERANCTGLWVINREAKNSKQHSQRRFNMKRRRSAWADANGGRRTCKLSRIQKSIKNTACPQNKLN